MPACGTELLAYEVEKQGGGDEVAEAGQLPLLLLRRRHLLGAALLAVDLRVLPVELLQLMGEFQQRRRRGGEEGRTDGARSRRPARRCGSRRRRDLSQKERERETFLFLQLMIF